MMNLLNLTSFNQIRGVLTVSEADLPDELLVTYGLEDDLAVELDGWAGDWQATIAAGQAESALEADLKKFRLLRLFAKYHCGALVATTAPVFVLTKSTDGSNEGQRSDSEGFLWLQRALHGKAAIYRDQFLGSAATTPTFVSRVTPDRDPVTEARSDVS